MQRESYWEYMGRRIREDEMYVGPTKIESELLKRVDMLERKIEDLGYDRDNWS